LTIPERFLSLGDSFTIGTGTTPDRSFPAVLARMWTERGRPVVLSNPAVNGYATDELIREELPLVASFRPTLITVLVGANDIVRGSNEDRYRRQLAAIHKAIADDTAGARVIALPQPDWSLSPAGTGFGDLAAIARTIERRHVPPGRERSR
jgi:lysophospholipase L1-like esterase